MFKCIAEGFKRRHLKGMTIKDERTLTFQNLETAKGCTLFWVAEDVALSFVDKIHKTLSKHMEVRLLSFMKCAKTVLERDEKALYVDQSDISYNGKFNHTALKEMLGREDALFIDLSLKPDVLCDYIVKCACAHCKIGMERDGIEHDVDFADVKDMDDFMDRLFELLTKINTY